MPVTTKGDYGTFPAADTIRFERLLPGPIERVWAYLTESDKRARWLAAGPMEPRPGGTLELTFHNTRLAPADAPPSERHLKYEGSSFRGRVLRCEPPRLLEITWGGESTEEDSEVTFELAPEGDEVRLVLTHRRLATRDEMLSVAGGWHTHLGILDDVLAGRAPAPFWPVHEALEPEYEQRIPEV